jgi:hypothetical protein
VRLEQALPNPGNSWRERRKGENEEQKMEDNEEEKKKTDRK